MEHDETRANLLRLMIGGATRADAARAIGISRTTSWRIAREPEFRARLLAARRDAIEAAEQKLCILTSKAAETLEQLVETADEPAVRLRASLSILQMIGLGTRGREAEVQREILKEIEEIMSRIQGLPPDVVRDVTAAICAPGAPPWDVVVLPSELPEEREMGEEDDE